MKNIEETKRTKLNLSHRFTQIVRILNIKIFSSGIGDKEVSKRDGFVITSYYTSKIKLEKEVMAWRRE